MDKIKGVRKFSLAVAFSAATIVGLFSGHIDQGAFIGMAATILGLYGGANVAEHKVSRA